VVYVRWYVPPATSKLAQQLEVPASPQLLTPGPVVAQLGALIVVGWVQAPSAQAPEAHIQG
jgi:hypothetical protein